jgi:small-conductance mechanosensitive channel
MIRIAMAKKYIIKVQNFLVFVKSYIPLLFEGRDEITLEDNYELDFEKIRERTRAIMGELENTLRGRF